MALMLRHVVGLQRTLDESPTRFKPLLYLADRSARKSDKAPGEATAWCEGYMAGVKLRDDEWQPLYDARDARDWIFPVEALAFGDHDPEFSEWIDDKEKRASLVDELPLAAVLIYRYWHERQARTARANAARAADRPTAGARRASDCTRAGSRPSSPIAGECRQGRGWIRASSARRNRTLRRTRRSARGC